MGPADPHARRPGRTSNGSCDEDVWNAFADQAQLELALVNLIINARDAMPAGGTVTMSRRESTAAAGELGRTCRRATMCGCRVTDTGTGISPDDLEKVMEPFFTTKELGKGSGLGLSMVYGFAKQSNGAFRLESELGTGTTAELWLPRAPERRADAIATPAERGAAAPIRRASCASCSSTTMPKCAARRRPCSRTSGTRWSKPRTAPTR